MHKPAAEVITEAEANIFMNLNVGPEPFGVTRVQRTLRIGYGRADRIMRLLREQNRIEPLPNEPWRYRKVDHES